MRTKPKSKTDAESVGYCPSCNSPIYLGEKSFWCSNSICNFRINRRYFSKLGNPNPISVVGMQHLIRGGCIPLFGLISQKTGEPFDCVGYLECADDGHWHIQFYFQHFALEVFRKMYANK